MKGRALAGASESFERVEHDFYATPPESLEKFLDLFDLSECKTFYEPCCGMGHLSKVLKRRFKNSKVYSSDLIDRGYGKTGVDFLKYKYNTKVDCVLTNPPYAIAKEFIEKSLNISNRYVVMFLKIQFLESKKRKEFLEKSPLKYIYVFSERQQPMRDGQSINPKTGKKWSSTMCFAWFIWDKQYDGEPIIRWI